MDTENRWDPEDKHEFDSSDDVEVALPQKSAPTPGTINRSGVDETPQPNTSMFTEKHASRFISTPTREETAISSDEPDWNWPESKSVPDANIVDNPAFQQGDEAWKELPEEVDDEAMKPSPFPLWGEGIKRPFWDRHWRLKDELIYYSRAIATAAIFWTAYEVIV